ncbi:MAG: Uma2 family endonuclease [Labilithrix sp.]
MAQTGHVATLLVPVIPPASGWELYEGTVPQAELHTAAVDLLGDILTHWARGSGARIVKDLAVRWVEEDARIGVNPDVAVLLPPPPVEERALESVRTWLPGHKPPALAIEVVSRSHPYKDYSIVPPKYAASGTTELWIFDPLLCGTSLYGGPLRLQIYRRDAAGHFARIYAGEGPAYSPALDAWTVPTDDNRMLRITADTAATQFWLTGEEAERAEKDAAVARIAELEAELARRGGG